MEMEKQEAKGARAVAPPPGGGGVVDNGPPAPARTAHAPGSAADEEVPPAQADRATASSATDRDAVLGKVEMERKLSMVKAWEEHEKSKFDNRAEKKMSSIQARDLLETHRGEMEVEYFPSQRRAGYGGAEARVPSAHKHRSFTTVPPTATSFRSTSCLECDLYMEDTRQSHAHRLFDGRSRVSLGQSSGGMAHGSSNSGLETEQGPCLQRKCTDPGDQPTTWRPGYQVSDEMPLSSFGHEHVQGRHCKVPAAPQDLYNSHRSTSHVGIQSELLSRASDSDTHQAFVIMYASYS